MNVSILEKKYNISFQYDDHLVKAVKALEAAAYDPNTRHWVTARTASNYTYLKLLGFDFTDDAFTFTQPSPEDGYTWQIHASLFKHQMEWQAWCQDKPRALLDADMGTGKTLMAMLWMQAHKLDPKDVLIICPSSLLMNWEAELARFAGHGCHLINGTSLQRKKAMAKPGLHVVNYEYLPHNGKLRADILAMGKKAIILDECHKIKCPTTARSKVIHNLATHTTHALLLTGTPVSQGAQDYYSLFRTINPLLLSPSFTAFKARYCEQEQVRGAPIGVRRITGYKNLDELSRTIAPFVFSVRKKDCLDLPDKIFSTRHVELGPEQRRFYAQLKREMAAWIDGSVTDAVPVTAANILTRMLRLSQVTQGYVMDPATSQMHFFENPKLEAFKDILEETSEPLVVICRFSQDIAAIRKLCDDMSISCTWIDGSVAPADRQERVDDFQKGSHRVVVGQIQTIGVGFNMFRASTMVFYSNSYSLTDRLQAEDRIHRIGQKSNCHYIDLMATDTMDEHIINALQQKKNISEELEKLRLMFRS